MITINAIKKFFKILLSRKKREPLAESFSEEMKTFYDTELIEMAQNDTWKRLFGEKHIPREGAGTTVYFRPYSKLQVDSSSGTIKAEDNQ